MTYMREFEDTKDKKIKKYKADVSNKDKFIQVKINDRDYTIGRTLTSRNGVRIKTSIGSHYFMVNPLTKGQIRVSPFVFYNLNTDALMLSITFFDGNNRLSSLNISEEDITALIKLKEIVKKKLEAGEIK